MSRFITPELASERFAYTLDEAAIARAQALDGKLVLVTNVTDHQSEDIVARYKALADIERGFRVLKSDLDIAPVFHRKPERLQAHALLCFLALLLHRVLRMRLREGKSKLSVTRALERLQAIQLHRVRFGLRTVSGLTRMTAE